jgi:hypothetical protein
VAEMLIKGAKRTGTINVNTGAENSDRWISAAAATDALTVGTSAPTAATSSIIWSDGVGSSSTILFVRTTKTAHGAAISWTVRRVHGWCGNGEEWPVPSLQLGISATAPAVGTGPVFMAAGGTGAENLLNLPATAVFVDAAGASTIGTTAIVFSSAAAGYPTGIYGVVLEFHLAATAIVTTNTYTIETQWAYVD